MKERRRWRGLEGGSVIFVLAVQVLAATPSWAGSQQARTGQDAVTQVTFTRDIALIFQQKCQVCHRPGSMAPMSLVTYEESRPWARSIKARVTAKEMPPWFLDKTVGIQKFKNDISLSDEQIDMIASWVDAGAPRGNPKDMPPPIQWPPGDAWGLAKTLGPPDHVVKSLPFTMPAESPDQWWRPVVDVGLAEDRWLRAIEVKPSISGRRIVHHAGTFLYQDEDAAFLEAERALLRGQGTIEDLLAAERNPSGRIVEANEDGGPMFTEWAIGKPGEIFENPMLGGDDGGPPMTGKLMKAGSKMGFEIHYHAVGEELTDQTEIGLWFYPKDVTPKYRVRFRAMASARPLEIPPHTVTVKHGYYTLPAPAIIQNFQPHMHYRGKGFMTEVIYPGGRTEVLNYVPNFKFDWHISYIYADDVAPVLPKGAVIHNVIWYDNTAGNRDNPDPRQFVTGGARSVDEMGHGNTNLVFISEEDYRRIVEEREKNRAGTVSSHQ